MRLKQFLFLTFIGFCTLLNAQKRNPFNSYLPIMENSSVSWKSPMNEEEDIVFDAQPTLYYQLYNTYLNQEKKNKQAVYIVFKSHLRMYQERSLPVKTPSYIGFLGYQKSFKWGKNKLNLALETGHYSNGQSRCAWDANIEDGTEECKAAFDAITDNTDLAAIYNRNSGNFSINLSKIILQYVIPQSKSKDVNNYAIAHRFNLMLGRNHENFAFLFDIGRENNGGDIQFVGDNFIQVATESFFSASKKFDLSIKNELEYIHGTHPSINPWRYTFSVNVFPLDWVTAFQVAFSSGHDNYNYRIVDSGNQFTIGVRWDLFDRSQYK